MQIIKEYSKTSLNTTSKVLGYCYKVIDENNDTYYYEFEKQNNIAYVKYDNPDYLEIVVEEFRNAYEYVNIIKSKDDSFYAEFDKVFTFKLPIECIQVSQLFLNENRIDKLDTIIDPDNIHLSVKILNDKYVLIGDHHLLYSLKSIGQRMVNVFINTTLDNSLIEAINNLTYVLKEQNISSIDKCELVNEKTYNEVSTQYIDLLTLITNAPTF